MNRRTSSGQCLDQSGLDDLLTLGLKTFVLVKR